MVQQLNITSNSEIKLVLEQASKESSIQAHSIASVSEIESAKQLAQNFSIIVIDGFSPDGLKQISQTFPAALLVVAYKSGESKGAIPDFVDEIPYSDLKSLKRLLIKKLSKLVELSDLRRRHKLYDSFLEKIHLPIAICRKEADADFVVETFNSAFNANSIIRKKVKQDAPIDLVKAYGLKLDDNALKEGVRVTKKPKGTKSNSIVDVFIFENKLKYSNLVYQVATEVERKIDESEIQRLIERIEFIENAKRTQSEFLASVAHDLRRPLNNIIGLVDILNESGLKDEQAYVGDSLAESSKMLKNLLSDVLDNSSIDSGHFEIVNELFEIRPFIDSVKTMFLNETSEKGIDFQVVLEDSIPVFIDGDRNRLSQILINLLSNAIKFTTQGAVKLKVDFNGIFKDKAKLEFAIIDTGIGIDADKIDFIFDSYNQGHKETKSKYGGTGLGLTITKKLTELMGGSITVQSEKEKGSTFSVEIPFGVSTVQQEDVIEKNNSLSGLSILVVDDNETANYVLSKFISINGGEAKVAYTGNEALSLFENTKIDLVITDIQLPDVNGIRLSNKLKNLAAANGKVLPVIGLSAFPYPKRLEKDGFLDHFALKPITQDQLLEKILITHETAIELKSKEMNYRVIDVEHIKNFTGGDHDFIKQLVDIFLKRTPEYMDELKKSVEEKDWTKIKTMAHKVKPTFTYVGMGKFTEKVGSIEEHAINKDIETINNILDEVWDDCQLAFDEFHDFVETID